MMIHPLHYFRLKLGFSFERQTFVNVGDICSVLHDYMKVKSSKAFANLVLKFSNDFTILNLSFPCFFLICLNIAAGI